MYRGAVLAVVIIACGQDEPTPRPREPERKQLKHVTVQSALAKLYSGRYGELGGIRSLKATGIGLRQLVIDAEDCHAIKRSFERDNTKMEHYKSWERITCKSGGRTVFAWRPPPPDPVRPPNPQDQLIAKTLEACNSRVQAYMATGDQEHHKTGNLILGVCNKMLLVRLAREHGDGCLSKITAHHECDRVPMKSETGAGDCDAEVEAVKAACGGWSPVW